jgi:hypothetical protein
LSIIFRNEKEYNLMLSSEENWRAIKIPIQPKKGIVLYTKSFAGQPQYEIRNYPRWIQEPGIFVSQIEDQDS